MIIEHVKRKQNKEKLKSFIKVEVKDPPWASGTRLPKQQNKPWLGFLGVQPTPLSPYSTSPYSPTVIRSVITNSADTFSHFIVPSTGSGLEPGKSVEPSLTANKVSPEVSHTQVERKTSWSGDVMQGDRSKIIRHIKRHAEQNSTKSGMISVDSSHPKPSEGKIPKHGETPYVRPDIRGMPKGRTTTPIWGTAGGTGKEMI